MSLKVVDGHVNLSLALIAEYTNEEHEPILSTKEVPVPRDHPFLRAVVDTWRLDEPTGTVWADDPTDDAAVGVLMSRLEALLEWFAGGEWPWP